MDMRRYPLCTDARPRFVGKTYFWSKNADLPTAISCIRYYAGWADKISGQVIEVCFRRTPRGRVLIHNKPSQTTEAKLTYTRHEPIGVVGQIIPWNFPREFSRTLFILFCVLTQHL